MARISAIVVTRNNRKDIERCIQSLKRSRRVPDEIIVIDNGSQDHTVDVVRREFPDVIVLDFWDNLGFGVGNNRGARIASGEYLYLLNPDAVSESDCLEHLLAELERSAETGIAVPKVVLASEPGVINSAGLCVNSISYGWDRGYLEWDAGQYDVAEAVLAGSGCAMLIRSSLYQQLGGFDETYFLYYEDLDLCWRATIAGQSVRYVPAAVVRHDMKVSGRSDLFNDYYDHRNRLRMVLKNESARSLQRQAWSLFAFEAGSMWAYLRWRQWSKVRLRASAWLWNVGHIANTWACRRAVQRSRVVSDAHIDGLRVGGRLPRLNAAPPELAPAYDDRVDRSQLHPTLTMGRDDGPALGLGWYGPDTFAGVGARWTCGYGIAFLAAPDSTSRARVTVRCATVKSTDVVIRTDHVERGRFSVGIDGWHDLSVDVPVSAGITRVDILVATTFVPGASGGSTDQRTLGVCVSGIALDPLPA